MGEWAVLECGSMWESARKRLERRGGAPSGITMHNKQRKLALLNVLGIH